jgi:tetratricopeptide (TPR) repeat protein
MNTTFDKSRELIKEATVFKNTDIQKAISLIEQAIQICPEFITEDTFKLAGYYHLAGTFEKAYKILFDLLNEMKLKSTFTIYNAKKSQVYEKICTLCYTDKKFNEYIFYYSLKRYNTNLAIYTQGRLADFERGKDTFDLFGTSYSTKIKSCFKKLNKESNIKIFSDKFEDFFISHKQDLLFILGKTHAALWL